MILRYVAYFVLLGAVEDPGRVDQVCRGSYCWTLAVKQNKVQYSETDAAQTAPIRTLALGYYSSREQPWVPKTEAPLRTFVSASGWRVLISVVLDHQELQARLRIRFIDPKGTAHGTYDGMFGLDDAGVGKLFGGDDDIFSLPQKRNIPTMCLLRSGFSQKPESRRISWR